MIAERYRSRVLRLVSDAFYSTTTDQGVSGAQFEEHPWKLRIGECCKISAGGESQRCIPRNDRGNEYASFPTCEGGRKTDVVRGERIRSNLPILGGSARFPKNCRECLSPPSVPEFMAGEDISLSTMLVQKCDSRDSRSLMPGNFVYHDHSQRQSPTSLWTKRARLTPYLGPFQAFCGLYP